MQAADEMAPRQYLLRKSRIVCFSIAGPCGRCTLAASGANVNEVEAGTIPSTLSSRLVCCAVVKTRASPLELKSETAPFRVPLFLHHRVLG